MRDYFPAFHYHISHEVISRHKRFIEEEGFDCGNLIYLTGRLHSKNIIQPFLLQTDIAIEVQDNSINQCEKLIARIRREHPSGSLIVAVGGGKVNDVGKYVSMILNLGLISIPTIVSNDGLISPIAVLTKNGVSTSNKGNAPALCLVDIDLIIKNDKNFLRSAAGDVLSNLSALNDWEIACNASKQLINPLSQSLSKIAAENIIHYPRVDLKDEGFIYRIIESQILSGLAMRISRDSRPCSGSEHLLSHACDYLGLSKHLHGIQVGTFSLLMLMIQGDFRPELYGFAKKISLPIRIGELIRTEERKNVFSVARRIRPGRYTILNEISDSAISNAIESFDFLMFHQGKNYP